MVRLELSPLGFLPPGNIAGMCFGQEGGGYAVGDMMEFIIIPDPSTAGRQKLEGYLSHKWGKSILRHPYGDWAPKV